MRGVVPRKGSKALRIHSSLLHSRHEEVEGGGQVLRSWVSYRPVPVFNACDLLEPRARREPRSRQAPPPIHHSPSIQSRCSPGSMRSAAGSTASRATILVGQARIAVHGLGADAVVVCCAGGAGTSAEAAQSRPTPKSAPPRQIRYRLLQCL